jgi:hypothetical protein
VNIAEWTIRLAQMGELLNIEKLDKKIMYADQSEINDDARGYWDKFDRGTDRKMVIVLVIWDYINFY